MGPIISIIVPVYKVENYLDQCIESIVNQTYENLEIILVDDGSPDCCPQMCDAWCAKDKRIQVVHQRHSGVSAARNAGQAVATGELIYFVDSDDYIDLQLCEKVVCAFSDSGADIVVFDFAHVNEQGDLMKCVERPARNCCMSGYDALSALLKNNFDNYAWGFVCRKEVYQGVRFPVGYLWEDVGTTYKVFLNAKTVCCLSERLYFYRIREGSMIRSINVDALCDIFFIRNKRNDDLTKIYPEIAELGVVDLAQSALALYDRCLWETTERSEAGEAKAYLDNNRERIINLNISMAFRLYYTSRVFYDAVRLMKHKVGNLVKAMRAMR